MTKRIFTICSAMSIILTLAGCSQNTQNNISEQTGTVEVLSGSTGTEGKYTELTSSNRIQETIYLGKYNNQDVIYMVNINNVEEIRNITNGEIIHDDNFGYNTTGYTKLSDVVKLYQLYYQDTVNNEGLVSIRKNNNTIYFSTVKDTSNPDNTATEITYIKAYNLSNGSLQDIFSVKKIGTLAIESIYEKYMILKDYPCWGCGLGSAPLNSVILNTSKNITLDIGIVGDIVLDTENEIVTFKRYEKTYESCDEKNDPIGCEGGKKEVYKTIGEYISKNLP